MKLGILLSTPENFFKRVSGPYLNTVWQDLLGLAEDHPTITTFAKLKKADKVERMHKFFNDADWREAVQIGADAEARVALWLPEGME